MNRVAENRGIEPSALMDYVGRYDELLTGVGGNAAKLALQQGLVDGIMVNQEVTERLQEVVGEEGESYRRVAFGDYVQPRIPPLFGGRQSASSLRRARSSWAKRRVARSAPRP